jgi:hypothetical protein
MKSVRRAVMQPEQHSLNLHLNAVDMQCGSSVRTAEDNVRGLFSCGVRHRYSHAHQNTVKYYLM